MSCNDVGKSDQSKAKYRGFHGRIVVYVFILLQSIQSTLADGMILKTLMRISPVFLRSELCGLTGGQQCDRSPLRAALTPSHHLPPLCLILATGIMEGSKWWLCQLLPIRQEWWFDYIWEVLIRTTQRDEDSSSLNWLLLAMDAEYGGNAFRYGVFIEIKWHSHFHGSQRFCRSLQILGRKNPSWK